MIQGKYLIFVFYLYRVENLRAHKVSVSFWALNCFEDHVWMMMCSKKGLNPKDGFVLFLFQNLLSLGGVSVEWWTQPEKESEIFEDYLGPL